MVKAFFGSRKWFPFAYGGGALLLLSLYCQVQMNVAINSWYGPFYNLLQKAPTFAADPGAGLSIFFHKIVSLQYISSGFHGSPSFVELAVPYVILATVTGYFTRRYGLWWREAMTFEYIPKWGNVAVDVEGSSQRIQEDPKLFADIVASLGLLLVRAVMTLIFFLPILWYMSQLIEVPLLSDTVYTFTDTAGLIDPSQIDGVRFVMTPQGIQVTNHHYFVGCLVWIALLTSLGGMTISWFVGWFLPKLQYNNQKREAAFRSLLETYQRNKDDFEAPNLFDLFLGVRSNYKRLFLHYGYFDIWQNLYGQCMVIVPYLAAGPSLFSGAIMFGVLRQVTNAFQEVHASFSLAVNNWTTMTELRSIWLRLHEFQTNIERYQVDI